MPTPAAARAAATTTGGKGGGRKRNSGGQKQQKYKTDGNNKNDGKKGAGGVRKGHAACSFYTSKDLYQLGPKERLEWVKKINEWYSKLQRLIPWKEFTELANEAAPNFIPWDVRAVVENLRSMLPTIKEYAAVAETDFNSLKLSSTLQSMAFSNSEVGTVLAMPADRSLLPGLFAAGHLQYGFVNVRAAISTAYSRIRATILATTPSVVPKTTAIGAMPVKIDFDHYLSTFYMYFGPEGSRTDPVVVCRFDINSDSHVTPHNVLRYSNLNTFAVTNNFVTVIENTYFDPALWNALGGGYDTGGFNIGGSGGGAAIISRRQTKWERTRA